MEDNDMTLAKVREWAKQLHSEGKELKLLWDGGGDSGWVHFEVDGQDVRCPEAEFLIEWCYDVLDYGSWAGEFYASGVAVYDPEEEAFVGEDNYSHDDYVDVASEHAIKLTFPNTFKFDAMEIETQQEDSSIIAYIAFRITNGFFPANMEEIEKHVADQLEEQYDRVVDKYNKSGDSYGGAYNNDTIEKTEMVLSDCGTYYTATYKDYSINQRVEEDKPIVLSLADTEDE